jgi:hypothetical protein
VPIELTGWLAVVCNGMLIVPATAQGMGSNFSYISQVLRTATKL